MNFGIKKFDTYLDFSSKVNKLRDNVMRNIKFLKKEYKNIIGYGSPAKATTLLNFYGIDNSYFNFTIEDNKLKQKKFIPGVNIPISKPVRKKIKNSILIVLAWNYFKDIEEKNKKFFDKIISIKDLENEKLNI